MNGRSQAVRLPVECRFDCHEVLIETQGDAVVLRPRPDNLRKNLMEFVCQTWRVSQFAALLVMLPGWQSQAAMA
jgi:virulence-associated protein VagC